METKLCGNHYSRRSKNLELVEQFARKTDNTRFQLNLENLQKEAKFFGGKISLYCLPHTGLKIVWTLRLSIDVCEMRSDIELL